MPSRLVRFQDPAGNLVITIPAPASRNEDSMADLSTVTLPVLPLTTGVVLPGMVLTVALETTEAQVAAKAAGDDGHLLLVPRVEGRYASVGVIARIEST